MALLATTATRLTLCAIATCAVAPACNRSPPDPGPDFQIVSESLRLRTSDPVPKASPFFDGKVITLVAARGETVAFQVLHRGEQLTDIKLDGIGIALRRWSVAPAIAKRPSTRGIYGAGHGAGSYPDVLWPARDMKKNPALIEITVSRDAPPGTLLGELRTDRRTIPIELKVLDVTLPPAALHVWAYYDPRELAWANLGAGTIDAPSPQEQKCIAMFRDYEVALSVDLTISAWPARKGMLADLAYVPVRLPKDPALVTDDIRAWIAATKGTGKLPFAIPIDEPRTPDARTKVKQFATAVRDAGGGPNTFLYAVTTEPQSEFVDLIDLYISLKAKRSDPFPRWTYNGAPPRAGSMVLDAQSPGLRTWGWISWRWNIPVWYVWDALYWHDRHNRKGAPLPGRAFSLDNAISFDDGEDHGNLDGVLALPGDSETPCRPTLRLASLRRGMQDRRLIELAARCKPEETALLVEQVVPRALGEVPGKRVPGEGTPSWPSDDDAWENARRKLHALAAACTK